jgi:protein TonB
MRILFTNILTLLFAATSFAQQTEIRVIKHYIPASKEVFYVMKYKPAIKQGTYEKKLSGPAGFKEKGQYEQNVRTGIWQYFDAKGKLTQKIDFTNDSVLLHDSFPDTAGVMILGKDGPKKNDTGKTPIFLGGRSKLAYYMLGIRYTQAARTAGIKGTVVIQATVTKDGRLTEEKVTSGLGYGLDEEALRVAKLLPDDWLPLKINGEAVDSRIFIPMKFTPPKY